MKTWPLQEAKAKLSELIKRACAEGAQEITLRGEPKVVVLAADDYTRLMGGSKPKLTTFLRQSPLSGLELECERDRSKTRDIKL
jgi:prevent-host-death family protein